MKNTYKLYKKIKELKSAAKNPYLSKEASWELAVLASELERKYSFLINLREELKKYEHVERRTNR